MTVEGGRVISSAGSISGVRYHLEYAFSKTVASLYKRPPEINCIFESQIQKSITEVIRR